MGCASLRLWVLSLKTEKLSYLRGKENKRIRQQNERIDQRKKQIKLHLSPPNQTSYRQLRLIYSTVAKGTSQQAWGRFNRSLIQTKTPSNQESVGIIPCAEGGNRTLIPGGNTILSRARLPIPPLRLMRSQVYHSHHEGQVKFCKRDNISLYLKG